MSITQKIKQQTSLWKGVVIFILILILLIPMSMVEGLMRERQYRSNDVANEISQQWSGSQTFIGPVLTVKYKHFYGNKGKYYVKQLQVMPEQLNMDINLEPQERSRGLFKSVVYRAKGSVDGRFDLKELKKLLDENMQVDNLTVSMGISDKRGISERIVFMADDVAHGMHGIGQTDVFSNGVEVKLDTSLLNKAMASSEIPFNFNLNLKGSQNFYTFPIAKDMSVDIRSSWHSPSFYGSFLPDEREVTDQGFTSKWNVLAMNHSVPSMWSDRQVNLQSHIDHSRFHRNISSHAVKNSALEGFGVQLIIPASAYQQSERSAKYAILFIALTFLSFFVAEVMNKNRVHPLQYLLIGLSLIMFYTLLVSFSEHFGFAVAYLIASVAITLLISGYAKAILGSKRLAKVIFMLLAGLYVYLYVLLQLESYALLMGSIGLFLILAGVMYLTRNIDWYQSNAKQVSNEPIAT